MIETIYYEINFFEYLNNFIKIVWTSKKMLRNIRILLWELTSFLENKLYPYNDDYYVKIKDDNTGEEYLIIDWIKSHNQKIDHLQDEMVYVKDQISKFQNKNG